MSFALAVNSSLDTLKSSSVPFSVPWSDTFDLISMSPSVLYIPSLLLFSSLWQLILWFPLLCTPGGRIITCIVPIHEFFKMYTLWIFFSFTHCYTLVWMCDQFLAIFSYENIWILLLKPTNKQMYMYHVSNKILKGNYVAYKLYLINKDAIFPAITLFDKLPLNLPNTIINLPRCKSCTSTIPSCTSTVPWNFCFMSEPFLWDKEKPGFHFISQWISATEVWNYALIFHLKFAELAGITNMSLYLY